MYMRYDLYAWMEYIFFVKVSKTAVRFNLKHKALVLEIYMVWGGEGGGKWGLFFWFHQQLP